MEDDNVRLANSTNTTQSGHSNALVNCHDCVLCNHLVDCISCAGCNNLINCTNCTECNNADGLNKPGVFYVKNKPVSEEFFNDYTAQHYHEQVLMARLIVPGAY